MYKKNYKIFMLKSMFFTMIIIAIIFIMSSDVMAYSGEIKIDAASAVVMDTENGRILFSKESSEKRAIASTTKIMTAIVAIENIPLEQIVKIGNNPTKVHGSTIGLKEGETYTIIELLYGLMLESGNDAAVAIAEHVGGNLKTFVDMMNAKAREIGTKDTVFKTPHGLDEDGQYSTAEDLALIARYAIKNDMFRKIVSTKEKYIKGKTFVNTNRLLFSYNGAYGIKTGYTEKAGRCLVFAARNNGVDILSVVLGCSSSNSRFINSSKIADYIFKNYQKRELNKKHDIISYVKVNKGVKCYVPIVTKDKISIALDQQEFENIKTNLFYKNSLDAPVSANTEVGYIEYCIEDKVLCKEKLITFDNILKKGIIDYYKEICVTFFSIF